MNITLTVVAHGPLYVEINTVRQYLAMGRNLGTKLCLYARHSEPKSVTIKRDAKGLE